jgi:predicted O-methyltransferase YrrM
MNHDRELWTAVDEYIEEQLVGTDAALEATLRANADAGLPAIDVAPNQGKFLYLLAKMQNAKRILEIGTLGGYSTIWLARALGAGGKVITLEAQTKHADVARKNIERAGVAERVEIRIGKALDSLAQLERENAEAFDLIFIDADKPNNPNYFEWALRFSHAGTVMVIDNVVREGSVVDANSADADVVGTRALFERIAAEKRVEATVLQTVGRKKHDGFAIVRVSG